MLAVAEIVELETGRTTGTWFYVFVHWVFENDPGYIRLRPTTDIPGRGRPVWFG